MNRKSGAKIRTALKAMEEDDWSRFVDSGGLFSQTDELSYLKIMNYAVSIFAWRQISWYM